MPESEVDIARRYMARIIAPPRAGKPRRGVAPRPSPARARRRAPWPLRRVFRECRSAPTIWLALLDLAGERAIVTPTRAMLAAASGIKRYPTISAALTVLERAGWIERVHVPRLANSRQRATLLRIVLRRRERKTFRTGMRAVENEFRSKGKERKSFQDSFFQKERRFAPLLMGAGEAPCSSKGRNERPTSCPRKKDAT
jgi:hypothetical protein